MEESGRRSRGGEIIGGAMEEESWKRNHGGGIMERNHGGGIMERNHEGGSCKRSHEEGTWRTFERQLGVIRSALRASGRRP